MLARLSAERPTVERRATHHRDVSLAEARRRCTGTVRWDPKENRTTASGTVNDATPATGKEVSLLTNLSRLSGRYLFLGAGLLLLAGCYTLTPYNQQFTRSQETLSKTNKVLSQLPSTITQTDLSRMRDDISQSARALSAYALTEARKNRNLHLYWTIGGLTLGLGATAGGAVTDSEDKKKKIAQVGVGTATFVAGVLAAHSFDANRKKLEACGADLVRLASKFEVKWGDPLGMNDIQTESEPVKKAALIKAFVEDADAIFDVAACQPSQ
jgi:hypothetical protein